MTVTVPSGKAVPFTTKVAFPLPADATRVAVASREFPAVRVTDPAGAAVPLEGAMDTVNVITDVVRRVGSAGGRLVMLGVSVVVVVT